MVHLGSANRTLAIPEIWHVKIAAIFGEIFVVSVSWKTKHENSSKPFRRKLGGKLREKIWDENSKNSGNFRSATFLT